jgi:LPXTG-site transpeptidase (sortase) family protein
MPRHDVRRTLRLCVSCGAAFAIQFLWAVPTSIERLPALPLPEVGIAKTEAQKVVTPAPAVPVRVAIPAIGVDADLESIGLLPGGKLDVPRQPENAGWYNLGPKPGETGNAVIDAHLDIGRTRGVFWDLRKAKVGDVVYVTDARNQARAFRVAKTAVYPVDQAPMQEIFGTASGKHLNLITCAGVWSKRLNHYDKRLVVYTEELEDTL